MIKTKKVTQEYEVCDTCGRDKPTQTNLTQGTVSKGGQYFCNIRCESYWYYPTKDAYIASRQKEEQPRLNFR